MNIRWRDAGKRAARLLSLLFAMVALGACDSILEVDLPGQVTEDALYTPGQAAILVNSVASLFECGYSDFVASDGAGYEDAMTRDTGWWGGRHEFDPEPPTGECNTQDTGVGWWTPLQAARLVAEETYRRIDSEWDVSQVPGDPEKLMAELAIYNGATYGLFGEHFCEVSFEGGPLMSPDEVLAEAEQWLTDGLGHISAAGGDFALPAGVTNSAEQLALLLRARVRWARGDATGAAADASQISQGFEAYVTRDAGGERTRWNKVYNSHNQEQINTVIGAVTWWSGPPNPATGNPWPDTIPFTGYRDLGILADGRAVNDNGVPITLADAGASADPRVPVVDENRVFNEHPVWRQEKYPSLDADIPLAKWEEAWIIQAKIDGGQPAVDRINEIRTAYGLPAASYVNPADADQVRNLILEDERRTMFLEGRWWSTKIQERLWFPRGVGNVQPPTTFGYLGGVRMVMPENEYRLNDNFSLDDRATLCDPLERPQVVSG